MSKSADGQQTQIENAFLAGYRYAASLAEPRDAEGTPPQPVSHLASILTEASVVRDQLQQHLAEYRRVLDHIKSLPDGDQESARVEVQQNLKHLLECCDATSERVRASSAPLADQKAENTPEQQSRDESATRSPETGKKRSQRR
jgi:predicted patatin/cPLA2 family phospholipase